MICLQIEKTSRKAKTPSDEFKVTIPNNPLINNRVITSMRNLATTLAYPKIPTYRWTFTPISNWTWSYSSLLSFDAQIFNLWLTPLHKSQYMTNSSNLNDCCWLQNFSLHQQWRSGMAYKHNSFSQRKLNSWFLYSYLTALKNKPYICLGLWEKKP